MESRRVTSVQVDHLGHVTRLINADDHWASQSCTDVVADLENGICSYYVLWAGEHLPVHVSSDGRHVRLVARTSPQAVDLLLQLPRIEHASALDRPRPPHLYGHLGD